MKVSIIIPAHNEEGFLAKTIEAALAQNYPDFEIIVVDNASQDKTAEVAKKYPVKLVTEMRPGSQLAREAGRKACTGELIANIDSDCLPSPDWLSRGAQILNSDSKIVGVTGPYFYYDGDKTFQKVSLWLQKFLYYTTNFIMSLGSSSAVLIGGNVMFKAKALEAAGGYNIDIKFYGDDTDTGKRLRTQGKVVFDNSFIMPSSARRFKSQGLLYTLWLYFYHFVKIAFFS